MPVFVSQKPLKPCQTCTSGRDSLQWVNVCECLLALTCSDAATVFAGHQRLGKTEDLLRRGAEVDSEDVACTTKLALLLRNLGRSRQAVPFCRQLIALEPKSRPPQACRCSIVRRQVVSIIVPQIERCWKRGVSGIRTVVDALLALRA